MKSPLNNARKVALNQRAGEVPQLQGALANWFQPMDFIKVAKGVSGGFLVESGDAGESWQSPSGEVVQGSQTRFDGVMIPGVKQLNIKGEGQRAWQGFDLYCTIQLQLIEDDVVIYLATQYRVLAVWPFKAFGFMHYFLFEDFQFSGPLQALTAGTDATGKPVPVTDNSGNQEIV
jgi:hypothetical protein